MSDASLSSTLHDVSEIVAQFAPDGLEITAGSRLRDDLSLDSIAVIELAYELEQRFSLPPLSDDDAMDVVTVGDLADLVQRKQEQST